jgi:hypothetical protein
LIRGRLIKDLEKFITSLTVDKNHDVILGIDANETLYDEIGESAILGLVERCSLIDVMASMNPGYPPPPTRCDSKRRADFIFATSGIHKNIIRYGIYPMIRYYIANTVLYTFISPLILSSDRTPIASCLKFIVISSVEIRIFFQNTRRV